ncbi:uncharacterized protein TRIADDRAFT_13732, partial [Trichoplax adhaerens]
IFYFYYLKPYSYFDKINIPGPKPKFIVGNLWDTVYARRHLCLTDHVKKYGKIFGLYYGRKPIIHVADPDIAYEILVKQSENFINRIKFGPTSKQPVGLIDARDVTWKHARESLTPLFSPNKLKAMSHFANEASSNLLEKVLHKIDNDDDTINVRELFYSTAMDMSLSSLFGVKPNEEKKIELQTHINNFLGGIRRPISVLFFALPNIYRFLSLFIAYKQVKGIIKASSMLREIVTARRRELDQGLSTRTDMLKLVIEAEHKEKISDFDIVQHCFTFLIGGYDTTASNLTFIAFALATNPDVQDKVIEEIDQYCPDEDNLNYNDIQKLDYLEMTINEAFRYFSAGYISLREAKSDCVINGVQFPKGVGIAIAVKAIHEDPDIWENPDKFDPQRFSADQKSKRHPCHFLPFSDGPRKCIGNRLGMMNLKLILVRLLQQVKFEVANQTENPLPTIVIFTAIPENPVILKVVRR